MIFKLTLDTLVFLIVIRFPFSFEILQNLEHSSGILLEDRGLIELQQPGLCLAQCLPAVTLSELYYKCGGIKHLNNT